MSCGVGVHGAHLGIPACVAGRAQANEQRYSKLKEKYSELVQNHADLLRKVGSPKPLWASPFPAMPPQHRGSLSFLSSITRTQR